MRMHTVLLAMLACGVAAVIAAASQFPDAASVSTLTITPFAIEGLTGDDAGNLYTTGRALATYTRCPLWRIDPEGGLQQIGSIGNASPGCGSAAALRD